MNNEIIPKQRNEIDSYSPLEIAGRVANRHARTAAFDDYLKRKSDNTIRTQTAALALFADFLSQAHIQGLTAERLQRDPEAWRGVTWGIVEAFVKWMLAQGYAVATVNNRLSVMKVYARLASKAGVIDTAELHLIKAVSGYSGQEAKRVDKRREIQRLGDKKADHVSLTIEQAKKLKTAHGDTPQGKRDAFLMCLLLDHGLRVSEVAGLEIEYFNLESGEMQFYRQKVDKTQTHRLTADTLKAATAYFEENGRTEGLVLCASKKGGSLTNRPMSRRSITKRVRYLGRVLLGLKKLSAHDCRHHWATTAARSGTDPFSLQEAGGWSSLTMPRRYVEHAKIANEGVKLSG